MILVARAAFIWRCPVCLYEREAHDLETITPNCPHGCDKESIYYSRDYIAPVVGPCKA